MNEKEQDINFKSLFLPFTAKKAVIYIFLIGFVVFFNALFNKFVLDDEWQIVNNTIVHSFLNFPLFFSSGTFNTGGALALAGSFYRPLMTMYFSIVYSVFGASPFPFHLIQLLLHITNSIFVFILFRKFFKKSIAIFLALVFLVHPMNQEVVVYVSDIQDILFFLFGISAILISLNGVKNLRNLIIVNVLFIFSLLSKESAIIFSPIIIFIAWLNKKSLSVFISLSLIIVSVLYLIFRFNILYLVSSNNAIFPMMNLTLIQRLYSIPAIIFYYISTFFYPQNLAIEQLWFVSNLHLANFHLPLLIDALFIFGLGLLGIYLYKNDRKKIDAYLFFLAWFIFGIALSLQIIPLEMTVATRWFYFPIVGMLGLVGLTIQSLKITNKNFVKAGYLFAVLVIMLFSIRTVVRNTNWRDALTLYSHDIQTEDNFVLENDLGSELSRNGLYDQAFTLYKKSVEKTPNWSNLYNLGTIYYRNKDYTNAVKYFEMSLRYSDYYLAYENLSMVLLFTGNPNSAKIVAEKGLSKLPYNSNLWYIYGLSEYKLGNSKLAIKAIRNSIYINSSSERISVLNAMLDNKKFDFKY